MIKDKIYGGEVLFASHTLEGSYFEDSVILLIDNNEDGVFGLIINRPSNMPISEVFNVQFDTLKGMKRIFYQGGPVDEDLLLSLQILNDPSESRDGRMISDNVELSGHWPDVEAMLMEDEKPVRIFLGYTGWREQQLQDELDEGSWTLYRGLDTKQLLEDWFTPKFTKRRDIIEYLESTSQRD